MKPIAHLAWVVCALLSPAAFPASEQGDRVGSDWVAMAPQKLDRMRGGFVLPSGLQLSFGIQRAVYVNGELVATASVNVPNIATITGDQARGLAGLQDTLLVQVGEGNTFVPNGGGGIVIQNTLDNQDIRTLTTLNIGANTLSLFQDLNANAALQAALITAPGSP